MTLLTDQKVGGSSPSERAKQGGGSTILLELRE